MGKETISAALGLTEEWLERSSNPEKAKAHIKKRAKEMGKQELIPEDW